MSLGALLGGLIGWMASYYIWVPLQARRVFRQQKSMQRPFELSWDATGVHAKDANGEYRHLWSDFVRWREGERLIVLSLSDAMFLMIPKRAFAEERSLEDFRTSVRSHVAS
jgi:YcxB-like protein